MPLIASAGLIATVSATEPRKPAALARLATVDPLDPTSPSCVRLLSRVLGVPLGGQLQLWVDHEVVRATGLMLDGVDVRSDAVVQATIVGMGLRRHQGWRQARRSPGSPRQERRLAAIMALLRERNRPPIVSVARSGQGRVRWLPE